MDLKQQRCIVVLANERVGYVTLEKLIMNGYDIRAVFTSHPDRKAKIADFIDFSSLKKKYSHIPFHYILSPREPLVVEKIQSYSPDIILAISWSQILPREIIFYPRLGTIGVHYSLLPERRGGAPLIWALIDGNEKTGLTLFYYDEGIDTGDIIDQIEIQIKYKDTVKTLLKKIEKKLPALVLKNLDSILAKTNRRIMQDGSKATYTSARTPKDGEINWSMPVEKIYDFIRAQTSPYPCAFSRIIDKQGNTKKLIIPEALVKDGKLIIKGSIEDFE